VSPSPTAKSSPQKAPTLVAVRLRRPSPRPQWFASSALRETSPAALSSDPSWDMVLPLLSIPLIPLIFHGSHRILLLFRFLIFKALFSLSSLCSIPASVYVDMLLEFDKSLELPGNSLFGVLTEYTVNRVSTYLVRIL
jgi:hypothetical protein